MTLEETRALASLATIPGYRLLLTTVVKSKREAYLDQLKTARGQEDIVHAAMEFRVWDEVLKELESVVTNAVAELKEQGDQIYG